MAEKPTAEVVYAIPTYQPCYKPPIFEFNQLATEKVDYFLVLDFEGVINKDRGSPNVMEVIEFPVLKINATTLRTESEFHTYVQPMIHPRLNSKCTEITGITQGMVDGKPILPDVLKQLDDWMKSEGLLSPKVKFIFVTCGDWDLKSGISTNCHYLKLEYQDYLKRWINIKTYFGDLMGKKGFGMKSMLEDLGLSLDGRHHSGIDDCRNIAKILVTLIKRGSSLRNGWVKPRMLVQKSRRHPDEVHKPNRGSRPLPSTDVCSAKRPIEKVDALLVLDFEVTYSPDAPQVKEIIEFSAVKIDVATLQVTPFFHSFVQPVLQPIIPPFISKECGISQAMVSRKPTLPELLRAFNDRVKGLLHRESNFTFVTFSNWELSIALPMNCDCLDLEYSDYLKHWISIRTIFKTITGKNGRDIASMLSTLKLDMSGRVGGVNSDALNVAQIMVELMKRSQTLGEGKVQPVSLARPSDAGHRNVWKSRKQDKKGAVVPHQSLPRFWFKELPKEQMDYFLILDFEANQNTRYPDVKEVIEFPVLKLNVKTLEIESTFHTYVQPTVEPSITAFITDLTGITQDMVKGQPILSIVLDQLHHWMMSEGLLDGEVNFIFVTCGDWDLKTALSNNCAFLKLEYHDYLKRWINIKTYFQLVTGKKGSGMDSMLADLGLTLDGRHHSGIDDSRNIAKILVELMRREGGDLLKGWVQPRKLMKS